MANALALRRAAAALEAAESAEQWCQHITSLRDCDIRLDWSVGGSCVGYGVVRDEVRVLVAEMWPELRATAVRRLRERADVELAEALKK